MKYTVRGFKPKADTKMKSGVLLKAASILALLIVSAHCGGRSLGDTGGDSGIFGSGDSTPPTIQSVTPAASEADIYLNPTVSVTFSETMGAATVNTTDTGCTGAIQISRQSDNFASNTCVQFAGAATVSGATISATTTNLIASTVYILRVTTSAVDAAGNPLASASDTTFTTGTSSNVAGVCDTMEDIRAIGAGLDLNVANTKTTIGSGAGTTCTIPQHTVTMVNRDTSNMGFFIQRTRSAPAIFIFTGSVDPTATLNLIPGDTITIGAGVWANLCVTHFRRTLQIGKYTDNTCATAASFTAGDFTEGATNATYLANLATTISVARSFGVSDESRLFLTSIALNITAADSFDYSGTYGTTATPFKIRKTAVAAAQLGIGAAVELGRMVPNRNNDDWEFSVYGSGVGGATNYDGVTAGGGENGFGFKNLTYTAAPVIASFSPAQGNLLNIGSTQISVTFDQQMNVATLTTATMKVVQGSDCSVAALTAAGNPAASNGNKTFTLTLTGGQLTNTTQYSTCITTGVQNISNVNLATASAVLWTATNLALMSDLIISEYMEGNSNNKLVEIYNGTGLSVNLDNYRLGQYNNGSATLSGSTVSFTAGTTLTHGQTWVVCNNSIDSSLTSLCNQTSSNVVNMNGDDAVVLQKDTGTFVDLDVIGDHTGVDPGTAWNIPAGTANVVACTGGANAGTTTCDTILKRKNTVTGPTATPATSFAQWNGYAASDLPSIEVYHGLGSWDSTPPTKAFNVSTASGSVGTTVTVTFNFEPTTATANTAGNYSIKTGTDCAAGTSLGVSAAVRAAKVVTLTTAAQVNAQQYIVCVTGVVRYPDNTAISANNWALFSGTADVTAPTVASTVPAAAATSTVLAGNFSATFSEAMNVANAQGAYAIKETDCSGTTVSAGSPAATVGNTVYTYALTGLKPSTVYAHCVTTAATDVALNALASAFSATFTTAALAEPTAPTYTPASGQVTLSWTNSSNADSGVKIVRADGTATAPADCTGTALCTGATCNATLTTGSAGRTYVDSTVVNGTQYAYRICSNHTGGYLSAGVTGTATPTNAFNVNSAASTANTTATVTYSAAPTAGTGASGSENTANYKIVAGAGVCTDAAAISVSGAVLAGSVVTLTTAAQSAVSYKVCVSNVTRNSDSATLTTNNATFTGTGAGATALLTELFDYGGTANTLLTVGSANWTTNTGTTGLNYITSSLSMTGYCAATGGSITINGTDSQDATTNLAAAVTSGTVYYSMLINVSAGGTGTYALSAMNGATYRPGRLFVRVSGGNVNFGLSSSATAAYGTTNFALNTDYLLVFKLDISAGSGALYVLTATQGTEPGASESSFTGASITDLRGFGVRQATNGPTATIDCLKMGTSWNSLIP